MKRIGFFIVGLMVLAAAPTVSADIISDLANATILEDFQFNDPSGTAYDAAANSINAGTLLTTDADLAGVVTNGSALDLSLKANDNLGTSFIDSANASSGRFLGVMELTWDFTSTLNPAENEQIKISLLDSGTSVVTAEFELLRSDNDEVEFSGIALGTGTNIAAQVLNGGSLSQTAKFIAVVDANLDTDTYSVHFSNDGGSSFTTLSGGTLDPGRGLDRVRVYLNNNFGGDTLLIDRIYLATIPEPSTAAMLLIGLVGVATTGRRRTN